MSVVHIRQGEIGGNRNYPHHRAKVFERKVTCRSRVGVVRLDRLAIAESTYAEAYGRRNSAAPGAPVVPVVEYYSAALDRYFVTWVADEIATLDAGVDVKGWARTGCTFRTYTTAQSGTLPVCRFRIPFDLGNSHILGLGTAECNAIANENPEYLLESPNFTRHAWSRRKGAHVRRARCLSIACPTTAPM